MGMHSTEFQEAWRQLLVAKDNQYWAKRLLQTHKRRDKGVNSLPQFTAMSSSEII